MNTYLRDHKQTIRTYLRTCTTQALCVALAHAQDRRMDYWNCSACLMGALHGFSAVWMEPQSVLSLEWQVSNAFGHLGDTIIAGGIVSESGDDSLLRHRRIIPILKAELRWREQERVNLESQGVDLGMIVGPRIEP